MDPRSINDSQFRLIHILLEDNGFTIAFGTWEDESYVLAMRWDGEGPATGYPVGRGGRAKWFVVQRDLAWPMLCSLLATPVISRGANVSAVVAALNVLDAERGSIKTIRLSTRAGCSAGHSWAPGAGPSLDTTIVPEFFTAPITMPFNLSDLRCPECEDPARTIDFQAAPAEM